MLDRGSPMNDSDDEDLEHGASAVDPIGLPLSQLKRLKTKFVDRQGKVLKLTLDQFLEALASNQPPAETQEQQDQLYSELRTLFKKIDASCKETVDWEEFTEYMLLHMPGLNVGEPGGENPNGSQAVDALGEAWLGSGHADMISDVTIIYDNNDRGGGGGGGGASSSAGAGGGSGGGASGGGGASSSTAGGGGGRRYVTAGRDGFVKVWNTSLAVHRAIDVGQHKGRWLTSCCWMSRSRFLAVASTNFRIYFFDSSFNSTPVTYIDHKDGTPSCLGYRECTEAEGGNELLMVGDQKGYVTVYFLDDQWWVPPDGKPDSEPGPVSFEKRKKPIRTKYHEGWVTKVGFVDDLQAMVTCGLDGEINMCNVHLNERKANHPTIKLHKKYGVHTWCWCKSYKFFASAGLDRQIIIWNPYTQMAMNYLQGHNAPILDIQVNEGQHQLISMSIDKVVKVWDIQHYRCIHTFTDKTEYKPEDRLTCMAFDQELPGLVMCSSTLNVLPMTVKVKTNRTHTAPIIGALYNDVFNQIVSGDSQGTVRVWDVRSGHMEFEFRRAHGDSKMTCVSFDVSKRRLFTGAEDGEVRLWNWSSGQHLRTFVMKQPSEINGLLWAQTALTSPEGPNTFVVALAWDRRIYVWPGSGKSTSGTAIEPKYVLEDNRGIGHTDDISCICNISTVGGLLATGSDDGTVVMWKIQETSSTSASPVACKLAHTGGTLPSGTGSRQGDVRVGINAGGSGLGVAGDGKSALSARVRRPQRLPLGSFPSATMAAGGAAGGDEQALLSPIPPASARPAIARRSCTISQASELASPAAPTTSPSFAIPTAAASAGGTVAAAAAATAAGAGAGATGGSPGAGGGAGGGSGVSPGGAAAGGAEDEVAGAVSSTSASGPGAGGGGGGSGGGGGAAAPAASASGAGGGASAGAAAPPPLPPPAPPPASSASTPVTAPVSIVERWPDELGFEEEQQQMASAAVEHLLFLEHRDCLLSTHADRRARVWSRERASLLQLLELEVLTRKSDGVDNGDREAGGGGSSSSSSSSTSVVAPPRPGAFQGVKDRVPVTALYSDRVANHWLFTGDEHGYLRMWDLVGLGAGRDVRLLPLLQEMRPHRKAVTHLQHFELDGQGLVMAASADWTISLSALDGEIIGTFRNSGGAVPARAVGKPDGPVYSMAFSLEGNLMAWGSLARGGHGSWDHIVRLWSTETGTPRGDPFPGHKSIVHTVAFSPDGRLLASASNDRTIRVWDVETGRPRGSALQGSDNTVRAASLAFSPDGRVLAAAGADCSVRLWDAEACRPIGEPMLGHAGRVAALAWSGDGLLLASGGDDRVARVWDAASGRAKGLRLQGHRAPLRAVAFSPDGKVLASGGKDLVIRLWDVDTSRARGDLQGHGLTVIALAFSPDGKTLASGSDDQTVRLWDAGACWAKGEPLRGHADAVFHVSFASDGKTVVSASYDKSVQLWDAETGEAKQLEMCGGDESTIGEERGMSTSECGESKAIKEVGLLGPKQARDKEAAVPLAGSQGPPWRLNDRATWNTQSAVPDEAPRAQETGDVWNLAARRTAKGAGRGGRAGAGGVAGGAGSGGAGAGGAGAGAEGLRSSRGLGGVGSLGMRTPRGGQPRTRPVVVGQTHCGRGIFKALSAVERFKPDPSIVTQEMQFLAAHPARASAATVVDH